MSLLSCLSAWADSFPLPLGPPPPPHHLPFLRLCCFFPFRVLLAGYRLGWANPPSLPPHQSPYLPLPSEHMLLFFRVRAFRPGPALPLCFYRSPFNDKAHTARLPHRTSTWVGLPPFPAAPLVPFRHCPHRRLVRRLSPRHTTRGHLRHLIRPKTFVGSISVHDITTGSLASSGKSAVDASAPPGLAFKPPIVTPLSTISELVSAPSYPSSDLYLFSESASLRRRRWKPSDHRRL